MGHGPNTIEIARPHAVRSPREQMKRRINLRGAGHADLFGNSLAKLFCDAADHALTSGYGQSAPRHSGAFHPFAPSRRHCSAPNVVVALNSAVSTGSAAACLDKTVAVANERNNEMRLAPQPTITDAGKITNQPSIGNREAKPSATPPRSVARHGCGESIFPGAEASLSPTTVTNPDTPQFAIIR